MNIAMIGHKRIPSREGGVEVVVEELSTRMVERGHSVTCYNRGGKHVSGKKYSTAEKTSSYKGVQIKTVFTIDKKGLAAISSSFFGAVRIAFSKYDVAHFHAEGPCAMLWIPKLFGKRCIATIHGLDWQRSKWGNFASRYIKFGEKTAVRYADEIIVLSKNVQDYFKKTYNRETVFIPNGVTKPENIEAEEIKEKYKINKDTYFLFLGRIVPEKGVHYLIEAYNKIKTDKKLVIAGGSSDSTEYFNELKDMGRSNENILFTDFVSGKTLQELYSNAYVYLLPSDLEGMPLSLLEAMSYGNCILGSDIAEIAEVVEDKGVLFAQSSVENLAQKLQELSDNPKTVQQYKQSACAFICNKYSLDDITEETLQLYAGTTHL